MSKIPLDAFRSAPYKQPREAAMPLLPFLGVSSLMNCPAFEPGFFLASTPGARQVHRAGASRSGFSAKFHRCGCPARQAGFHFFSQRAAA
ncbi:MAG: hypothetical protein J7521_13955 [Caulobacter sp.]|nr:hypothetical protein [Caulobacter sp.]